MNTTPTPRETPTATTPRPDAARLIRLAVTPEEAATIRRLLLTSLSVARSNERDCRQDDAMRHVYGAEAARIGRLLVQFPPEREVQP